MIIVKELKVSPDTYILILKDLEIDPIKSIAFICEKYSIRLTVEEYRFYEGYRDCLLNTRKLK